MDKYYIILRDILRDKPDWIQIKKEFSKYDIHDSATGQKTTIAGKIFEVFCKYYFKLTPTEKDNYKNIWLYNEIPTAVRQGLNLTTVDYGVDLLLENYQGEFYAVQCKFRNDESIKLNWTADKIGNLFGYCPKASGYIVFTNASDLDSVSKSRHDNFTFYSISNLLELDQQTIQNIFKELSNEKQLTPNYFNPLQHQEEAIVACLKSFEQENKGQLILPCGAGKTLTALWIKERLKCVNTLVLVPSLALLRQIKNDWAKQKRTNYHYICVCSENDIDSTSEDSIVAHTYEVGGHVTSSVAEIWAFLQRSNEKVIFSTYQSLSAITTAIENKKIQFDLVFCDEAHKTAGIGKKTFSLVHDHKKLPASRRLYATATPRIVKDSIKKKLGEDLQYAYDMSDAKVYGEEFYRMSFKDAIEKNILVDYKIIAIGVNDTELQDFITKRRLVDSKTSIDEIANNYALKFVMEKYEAFHALTFHSRVKYAKEFSDRHSFLFPEIKSYSVSGDQATSERNIILTKFKNSTKSIVSNARCLTEGVDVPAIDLIYFCDPKNSKVDIVQAVGRALRKKEGKRIGYVVVPIFHKEKNTLESSISQGSFKNLIQVIRSLCDQDERLQDEINFLAYGKGKRISKQIDVISTGNEGESGTIKLIGFEERLRKVLFEQIVEKTSNNWDLWFLQLKEYLQINNKYPSKVDNTDLYNWIAQQRNRQNNNNLNQDQITKLNSIDFIWDLQEFKWEAMYEKLIQYRATNEFEPADDYDEELSTWHGTQKQLIKKDRLREDRKQKILDIKFIGPASRNKWIKQFEQLATWKKENADKWPSYDKKNPNTSESKLHVFCQIIRKRYRETDLDEYWLNRFISIGFNFEGRKDNWFSYYNEVKELIADKVSISVNEIGHNANSWIRRHWQLYNKNKIKGQQRKLIEDLNLSRFFETWNVTFSKVESWKVQNGRLPTKHANKELNTWLLSQRTRYKIGTLSNEQVDKLNEIGFDLIGLGKEKDKERWLEQFYSVKKFRKENPERWPSFLAKEDSEKKLYNWCQSQRQAQAGTHSGGRRKPLYEWQVEKLNSIGFRWTQNEIHESNWNENYEELKSFLSINSIDGLSSTSKLWRWIYNQKKAFNKGNVDSAKVEMLQSLGVSISNLMELNERGFNRWANSLKQVSNFIKTNNRYPQAGKEDEKKLYQILARTKRAYKSEKLTEKHISLLKVLDIEI